MADANMQNFADRLTRINRRHAQLANGHVAAVNKDGLIVIKPRSQFHRFPWRGLMFTAALLLLFKGFLYASLGPEAYDARVEKLQSGTLVEQAGAFAMQAEPTTIWISEMLAVFTN